MWGKGTEKKINTFLLFQKHINQEHMLVNSSTRRLEKKGLKFKASMTLFFLHEKDTNDGNI